MEKQSSDSPYVLNVTAQMLLNIFGVYDYLTINYRVILKKAVSF